MKSLKTSIRNIRNSGRNRGFTIIEILVVIGIFAMLSAISLIVSLDSYRGYMFRNERDLVVTSLQKARSQSVNNVCYGTCVNGKPHGVAFSPVQTIIFQGTSFALRDISADEVMKRSYDAVSITPGSLGEVVFAQLSGDVTTPGYVTITDGTAHTSTTTISSNGQITWTN